MLAVALIPDEGMARPVKALCGRCGAEVDDPLTGGEFACPACGAPMRSRASEAEHPAIRKMAERAAEERRAREAVAWPYAMWPARPTTGPGQPAPPPPQQPHPRPSPQPYSQPSSQPYPRPSPQPSPQTPAQPYPWPYAPPYPPPQSPPYQQPYPPPYPPPYPAPYPYQHPAPYQYQYPPPSPYPARPAPDPLDSIVVLLKRLAHRIALAGVLSLAAYMLLAGAVALWSIGPVAEAALRNEGQGVLFTLLPFAYGESHWSGASALAVGAAMLLIGVVMSWFGWNGRWRGLGGFGTRFGGALLAVGGLAVMASGGYLAATGHMTVEVTTSSWVPTPIGIMWLFDWQFAWWHGLVVTAILLSLTVLVVGDGPAFAREWRRASRTGDVPSIRTSNGWVLIFRIFLGMLFLYTVYYTLLGLLTVSTSVPEFGTIPIWAQLQMFAEASVYEELLSRVLMLGVPLLLYYRLAGRRRPVPRWRFVMGGGVPIDSAAMTIVVFQAVVFGLAHVSGWDVWKSLPTMVTGMFFGYLFLARGLWAAIVLHFTFDYIDITAQVIGAQDLASYALLSLLWLVAGAIICVHFLVLLKREGPRQLRRLLDGRPLGADAVPAPTPPRPMPAPPAAPAAPTPPVAPAPPAATAPPETPTAPAPPASPPSPPAPPPPRQPSP